MERQETVARKTKETDIFLRLGLDGSGKGEIDTGIGFLDHMLEGFARHGFFDLEVKVKGPGALPGKCMVCHSKPTSPPAE